MAWELNTPKIVYLKIEFTFLIHLPREEMWKLIPLSMRHLYKIHMSDVYSSQNGHCRESLLATLSVEVGILRVEAADGVLLPGDKGCTGLEYRRHLLLGIRTGHDLLDEVFVFDVTIQILRRVCELEDLVDLVVAHPLAHGANAVGHFRQTHAALAFTIEGLEAFHEVSISSCVCFSRDTFIDGEDLFERVLLLAEF